MRRFLVLALVASALIAIPAASAAANGDKADICHVDGQGVARAISASAKALPAHLAHGDGLVGGDDFDSECVAVCQPATVIGTAPSGGDTSWTVLVGSFPTGSPGLFIVGVANGGSFSIEVPSTFDGGGNVWDFPASFFLKGNDRGEIILYSTGYFELDCGETLTVALDNALGPWDQ